MPTITRIVQQKDINRANLYLDGKFAFGITLENLLLHNLHVNKELSLDAVNKLKEEDNNAKIINRAIEFASRRPRSEKEVVLWFKRKKVDESVQGVALHKLKNLSLLNDLEFAKWWIEQRNTFRPKPVRILKYELRSKGVANDIIEEALDDSPLRQGSEGQAELETARRVVAKKVERFKRMPLEEGKKKLSNFLAMRGFSWDTIKQILEEYFSKEL